LNKSWSRHRWLFIGVAWHCGIASAFAAGGSEMIGERPLITLSPQIEPIEDGALSGGKGIPATAKSDSSQVAPQAEPGKLMFPAARQLFRSIHFPTSFRSPAPAPTGVVKTSHPEPLPTLAGETPMLPPQELIPPLMSSTPVEIGCAPEEPCVEQVTPKTHRFCPAIRLPHWRAMFGM
jgi:hypothetical protein